jgi:hypothetical protein
MMRTANKAHPANPAITLSLHAGRHRRGVADAQRSAAGERFATNTVK